MPSDQSSPAYIYQAFGLILSSEIAFPELFVPDNPQALVPDVTIRLGKAPAKESVAGVQKPFSAYNATEFWQMNRDIAIFHVKDGREILVEPLGTDDDVRLFFLGNALPAILYQRDLIPLHASGVVDEAGDVWLFTAPSRTGKSTLLYALRQMGYQPFTDDVSVLQPAEEGNDIHAVASWPVMKLWTATFKAFGTDDTPARRWLRPNIDKYGLDFHQSYMSEPAKVKGIVVLQEDRSGQQEISIERLSSLEAFKELEKNVFRRRWVEGMDKTVRHFRHISLLAGQVPVYLAKRPANRNTIREFAAAIHREVCAAALPPDNKITVQVPQ